LRKNAKLVLIEVDDLTHTLPHLPPNIFPIYPVSQKQSFRQNGKLVAFTIRKMARQLLNGSSENAVTSGLQSLEAMGLIKSGKHKTAKRKLVYYLHVDFDSNDIAVIEKAVAETVTTAPAPSPQTFRSSEGVVFRDRLGALFK